MARPARTPVADIDRQIAKLQAQRDTLLGKEKKGVVARIKDAIQHYGIEVHELFSGARKAMSAGKPAQPAKRGRKAGGEPAVVKFRDGENTWAGRGKRPRWLQEKLAAGAKLEDFLVK